MRNNESGAIKKKITLSSLSYVMILVFLILTSCDSPSRMTEALRVKTKADKVKELIQMQQQQGYDVSSPILKAKRVKELGDQGKLNEVDVLLDEILDELDSNARKELSKESVAGRLFGEPQPVKIIGYDDHAMEPFISRDGQLLFFNNLNSPKVDTKIHWAKKINEYNFQYMGEVEGINTPFLEAVPSMDKNNNFFFISTRNYDKTLISAYRGKFLNGRVENIQPIEGISRKKGGWVNMDMEISADGNTLYYVDAYFKKGGEVPLHSNLSVAKKVSDRFVKMEDSEKIISQLNTEQLEYACAVSIDEKELFFTRAKNIGALSGFEMLIAIRKDKKSPFNKPEILTGFKGYFEAPTIDPDNRLLYYHKKVDNRFHIYAAER